MLERIKQIDIALFKVINGSHSPFLDTFFETVSWKHTWIIYLPILYFIFKRKGLRYTGFLLLGVGCLFACSDLLAARVIKPFFERLRPCHNPDLESVIHIVNNHCGGQFGFVSNHASNHFALAVFMALVLRPLAPRLFWLPLLFAALVAYSRVYLGVHYPADVFVGGLLGLLLSALLWKWWNKYFLTFKQ